MRLDVAEPDIQLDRAPFRPVLPFRLKMQQVVSCFQPVPCPGRSVAAEGITQLFGVELVEITIQWLADPMQDLTDLLAAAGGQQLLADRGVVLHQGHQGIQVAAGMGQGPGGLVHGERGGTLIVRCCSGRMGPFSRSAAKLQQPQGGFAPWGDEVANKKASQR